MTGPGASRLTHAGRKNLGDSRCLGTPPLETSPAPTRESPALPDPFSPLDVVGSFKRRCCYCLGVW